MARKAKAAKATKPPKAPKGSKATKDKPLTAPAWPPAGTTQLTPEQATAKLDQWYKLRQRLEGEFNELINTEMGLRKELFAHYNPNPEEGTTTLELGAGWKLQMVYGIDRKFDEPAMDAVFAKLPAGSRDWLVRNKPELQTKTYKEMPADLRKIVDECIVSKPTAPVLRLVPPKSEARS